MAVVEFVEPTAGAIQIIADDMREADRAEIWASHRSTPLKSLIKGVENSVSCAVVQIGGIPCAIVGLVIHDILSGKGSPWLLGTDHLMKHQSVLLKESPAVIDEMLKTCPKLFNHVHVDNKSSIRWLKWLGFKLASAEPYGVADELFHKFELKR